MTDLERRQEAGRFADRIETQIRKMGFWREGPPPPEGLVALYLVLQYGLVDRLRQHGLPRSSNISTLATRELESPSLEEDQLLTILREFDDLVGGVQVVPAATPPSNPSSNPAHNVRRSRVADLGEDAAASCALKPAPVEIVTMEVELPGGRREQIAVAKGMEEQVRKIYAEMAKPKPEQAHAPVVKTCPHLEPLERAIEDAIAAAVGRFEAQGFSLQGPDPRAWGCPGPGWRCYYCGGGRAQTYLDTAALRKRLHFFSPPVSYEESTDPHCEGVQVLFTCRACNCAILGDQVPAEAGGDGFKPWSLIIA
jgi:uncharacterized protein YqcC (DUF446 family)